MVLLWHGFLWQAPLRHISLRPERPSIQIPLVFKPNLYQIILKYTKPNLTPLPWTSHFLKTFLPDNHAKVGDCLKTSAQKTWPEWQKQVQNIHGTLCTTTHLFCPAKDDFFFQKICIIHFLQNMWYLRNKLRLMHGYHTLKAMEEVPLSFLVIVAELQWWGEKRKARAG